MDTATSAILGQHEANLKAQSGTDRIAADKNTFLTLLVAQLTHQDPLNPTEDKEFIAQLAQFTSVEELQNINKGMQGLNDSYLRQQTTNAVNMIGKNVAAKGDMISLRNGSNPDPENLYYSSVVYATFPKDAVDVIVNVYSTDADDKIGRLVYSEKIGGCTEGMHDWAWHGMDNGSNIMPDGNYIVNFSAVDAKGEQMFVTTESVGTVALVETQADGNHKLVLDDGRVVYFNNINRISSPKDLGGETGSDPEKPKEPQDPDEEAQNTEDTNTPSDTGTEPAGAKAA